MNNKIKAARKRNIRKRHLASKEVLSALIDTNKAIENICKGRGFGNVSVFELMNRMYIQNKKAINKSSL